jgi:hypothetical protein
MFFRNVSNYLPDYTASHPSVIYRSGNIHRHEPRARYVILCAGSLTEQKSRVNMFGFPTGL